MATHIFKSEEPMKGLLSKEYAKQRAGQIKWDMNDPKLARQVDSYPFKEKPILPRSVKTKSFIRKAIAFSSLILLFHSMTSYTWKECGWERHQLKQQIKMANE
jgi:hypothetical protein